MKKPTPDQARIIVLEGELKRTTEKLAEFGRQIIELNARNTRVDKEQDDLLRKHREMLYGHEEEQKKNNEERRELAQKLDKAVYLHQQLRSHIIEYFAAMASQGACPLPRQVAMQRRIAELPPLGYNPNGYAVTLPSTATEEFPPGGHW
jgi:hypothetical protein